MLCPECQTAQLVELDHTSQFSNGDFECPECNIQFASQLEKFGRDDYLISLQNDLQSHHLEMFLYYKNELEPDSEFERIISDIKDIQETIESQLDDPNP